MKQLLVTILCVVFALPVISSAQDRIVIPVHTGFNLISSNIHLPAGFWVGQDGPDLRRAMAQLGVENNLNPVFLMADERGRFWSPRNRFCNIPCWRETEGYAVEMNEQREIVWEGERLAANTNLQISAGWNYVAYFPNYQLDASSPDFQALSPVIDRIQCAMDDEGGIMLPAYEFSSMAPWREGRGYMVRAAENLDMQYPEEGGAPEELWHPLVADHWQRPITRYLMPLLVNEIQGGDPSDGDMIAAFRNEMLVGFGTVQNGKCGIAVCGDNPAIQGLDGLEDGGDFRLVYWIAAEDREVETEIVAEIEGDNHFSMYRITVFVISADIGQRQQMNGIHLNQGWNMVSINFIPDQQFYNANQAGPDVPIMFAQLARQEGAHRIRRVVDQAGRFYLPSFDFNQIPNWPLQNGLWVLVDESCNPEWLSSARDPREEISLRMGWNIAAYLPDYQLDASAPDLRVLASIRDQVIIAKNDHGQFMFPSRPFSNMDPWQPGEGYQIKTSEAVVFSYPLEADRLASPEPAVIGTHWILEPLSDRNMSLLITDVPGATLQPGDQIAAYSLDNHLVGVGDATGGMCGVALWGREPASEAGLAEGEAFTLRLWQEARGVESPISLAGEEVYHTDGVTVGSGRIVGTMPTNPGLLNVSPNPFNATAHLEFSIPEAGKVSLGVYDLNGALVTSLHAGETSAGYHSVVWNASAQASGVYLVRLHTPFGKSTARAVLIK